MAMQVKTESSILCHQ